MKVLWETGPANVQTVQQRLENTNGLHDRADNA